LFLGKQHKQKKEPEPESEDLEMLRVRDLKQKAFEAREAKRQAREGKYSKCFFCGKDSERRTTGKSARHQNWPYCSECYETSTGPVCATAGCENVTRLSSGPGVFHRQCNECRAKLKSTER
jgi:hypothetical protein